MDWLGNVFIRFFLLQPIAGNELPADHPRLGVVVFLELLGEVADTRIEVASHHRFFRQHSQTIVDEGGGTPARPIRSGRRSAGKPTATSASRAAEGQKRANLDVSGERFDLRE